MKVSNENVKRTKNYVQNKTQKTMSKTNPIKKYKLFLFHMWHWSSYICNKPGDKSWMMNGSGSAYDKRNLSVVICNTNSL